MTIHKTQEQMFHKVDIHLSKYVLSHGRLYVAFSYATAPKNVKVLLEGETRGGEK